MDNARHKSSLKRKQANLQEQARPGYTVCCAATTTSAAKAQADVAGTAQRDVPIAAVAQASVAGTARCAVPTAAAALEGIGGTARATAATARQEDYHPTLLPCACHRYAVKESQ